MLKKHLVFNVRRNKNTFTSLYIYTLQNFVLALCDNLWLYFIDRVGDKVSNSQNIKLDPDKISKYNITEARMIKTFNTIFIILASYKENIILAVQITRMIKILFSR